MPALKVQVNQTVAVVATTVATVAGSGGGGGAPSGPAGGVLAGSYPNPAFAVDMATQAELDAAASTLQTNIDAVATGMRFKDTVRVATTANVNVANPGTAVFDGLTMFSGDSVLLVGQTTPSQNGAYTFNGSGVAMTRRADSNTSAEVKSATTYPVSEGTSANQLALLTTDDPITLGTTALGFQFLAPGAGITASIVDAKGDQIVATADNAVGRFAVGADGTSPIADAAQPFGMRWGVAGGSASAEFGGWDGSLASPIAVGDRTFTLTAAPLALFNNRAVGMVIDPGPNAEYRGIASLTGATFTIPATAHAFRLAHAAGARVKWITAREQLTPFMFGAKEDAGVTDDWRACQRCYLETGTFYGSGGIYYIRQPFYHGFIRASQLNFRGDGSWTPTKQPGYQFIGKGARQFGDFTASAATNRITFTDGIPSGFGVDKKIAFNNPYGETIPGGIVSGCIYRVETVGANYVTLKHLAVTGTPGTQVDITSDGAGFYYTNMDSLTHYFVTGYRFNIYTADLGGWSILPQQTSTIISGQFESFSEMTTPRTVIAFDVGYTESGGQAGNFFDVSLVPGGHMIGLAVGGTGYYFGGCTPIVGVNGPYLVVVGQAHTFESVWLESLDDGAGIEFGASGADAIKFGNILHSNAVGTYAFEDKTTEGASFTMEMIRWVNSSQKLFLRTSGYNITGWDGSGSHHANIGDTRLTAGPIYGRAGGGLWIARQPQYANVWRSGSEGATLTLSYQYEQYAVDTGTTPLTVTIPAPIGLMNSEFGIVRVAGSSSYTLLGAGSAPIMDDAGVFQTTGVVITDNLPRRYRPVYPGFVLKWARC